MSIDRLLARVAERQHGLIAHAQALECGLSDRQIQRRVLAGRLVQVRIGVYAIAGAPPTQEQAWLAAVLAASEEAWLAHRSAAELWRLRHRPPSEGIHILTAGQNRVRLDGVVHHRSGLVVPKDVVVHRRIPTLTAARTLAEVSGAMGDRDTGRSLDDGLRRRLFTLEDVRACHARLAGPGRRRLRHLKAALRLRLPGYDPGGSDLEIQALTALGRAGLPLPEQQYRIRVDGHTRFIDLAYPEAKIAIELEGWEYHGWRSKRRDDRARVRELIRDGWTVLEFGEDDSVDELVLTVATLLARAAA